MERGLTLEEAPVGSAQPVATYEIRGGDGIRLHAQEWGNPEGPELLFIHGWSQSDLCWAKQVTGELAARCRIVTFDLRGHGLSEKPPGPEHYADGRLWADDLAAMIEQTRLQRPVVVAWSYGGFVVADFLHSYGDAQVSAINLVGAATVLKPPEFVHLGPGLLDNADDMCAADLATNIAALRRFLRACTVRQLDEDALTAALCWNMVVPPEVRGGLISREIDGSDAYASMSVPLLVTHGRKDAIVLPSMAAHVLDVCEEAIPSWYDDVGHMPFWEAAERFDRELGELCDRVGPRANV